MKTLFITIPMMLSLLFNSCSSKETEKNDTNRLHDIWALESIDSEKIVIDESIKYLPMLEIYVQEKRVHGNTSCNSFDGSVKIEGNKISFSHIVAAEIACAGDLEQRFLSALAKVENYKIEKMRLFLYEDKFEKMVFRKID